MNSFKIVEELSKRAWKSCNPAEWTIFVVEDFLITRGGCRCRCQPQFQERALLSAKINDLELR
jgi:hypothetical protein